MQAAPDNKATLKQAGDFLAQLENRAEEALLAQDRMKHVTDTFSKALGGSAQPGADGAVVRGRINGVPVSAHIKNKGAIRLDTPTDGSCSAAVEGLLKELEQSGVALGPIKVVRTGQTLHAAKGRHEQRNRHRA